MSLKFLVFFTLAQISYQLTPVTVVGVNSSGSKLQNELCTTCGYCYTGTNSWYVSTVGYTLSKVDLWIPSSPGDSFYAM
jgi:heterodisulfide reductase subunit A-like polyferredoxin